MIDSRDFIVERKRATRNGLVPACPKVAISGDADFNDPVWRFV
ncbi:hypothetical protein [Stappia sp. ES.058]